MVGPGSSTPSSGTYNFVAGLDWWCSAVALTDGDDLVLGAVHHPASGTTYVGGPKATPTVDGVPMEPLVDRPLAESCLTTYLHPPFFGGEVGDAFGRMANGAATVRMLGSGTMDAMAVAQGRLQVLCQHSRAVVGRACPGARSSAERVARPVGSRPPASSGTSRERRPPWPRSAPRSSPASLLPT